MHNCLRRSMRFCRWMGLFPVEGLDQPSWTKLRSLCIYCLTLFNTTNLVMAFLLMLLGRNWAVFMKNIVKIEHCMKEIQISETVARKSEYIFHVLLLAQLASKCMDPSDNAWDYLNNYFLYAQGDYFRYIPYSFWMGILLQIADLQAVFLWTFNDVLLISFSTYLVSYFQNLNKIIYSREKMKDWKRIRLHYSHAVALVTEVDVHIRSMSLVTIFVYLYFICFQLYNTIKQAQGKTFGCDHVTVDESSQIVYRAVYYIYSTGYLVVRCFMTSLLAANIHLVAGKPLIALNEVPSKEYTIEVQRFQMQIRYAPVALSGLIFTITRKTILNVIATITTYELVMLQFHVSILLIKLPNGIPEGK
ncbi:gustatory receptor for sugar taste 64e-like [Achroia grisella]|uniref:gustatory receptor for sugar taste 64e-like n=1 Tax=Achroia grisella TaxID=688607 RepID=UPI0027D334FD|nr:gustatory receptor for sugar taste 64e-like [Achroia grisella]